MFDVENFISSLEVFASQESINYTMMKKSFDCTKHLEIDSFSSKMKIRIKKNDPELEYELIYDPDMDWIIYGCRKTRYISIYGDSRNIVCRKYFKQISTKHYEYVPPAIIELIKQLHEHIIISIKLRERNG
ncbi:hypothetical protein SEPL_042 [Salmonella phage SE_PL]|uniref:hypothetical protein n=1 Tax=Salmonella enterica TaxID=28901 RepID=UPI0011649D10|nr:hypothetical protein 7t3_0571 [Salmonella phage 7t3]QIG62655.1 hypothetical protein SEPL_042 [Salmonella phage SE_PL]WNV47492.1 hypothetical protein [Klebsiella phage fENko-Kae01]